MGRFLAMALLGMAVYGGPRLYLKTRTIEPGAISAREGGKKAARRAEIGGRQRLLIQMDHAPQQEDLDRLTARGIAVLGYVHENGLMVACEDCGLLDEVGPVWVSRLEPADKVSPSLLENLEDKARLVLVELHADVDGNQGRRILLEEGALLRDSPSLGGRHLLAEMDAARVWAVARREEVAYLFPALEGLETAVPHIACAGSLSGPGLVAGQYTAKVGEGWDGAGRGSAALEYAFQSMTNQLPAADVQREIQAAMAEWARVAMLTFQAGGRSIGPRTINILFGKGSHGDGYPFDGPSGVLAHTFYPSPPNPEPMAGDMHFDDDEVWRIGWNSDVYSVALHELGHALGLGHADLPGSVMYPYYSRHTSLQLADIAAIQDLYAARTGTEIPAGRDSRGDGRTNPPTTPGTPTPPAPLAVNIQSPPASVAVESIVLLGSVSGATDGVVVSWATDRGHAGMATGGASWRAEIRLEMGANRITVTAVDGARMASGRVSLERGVAATGPVTLEVTYPSSAPAHSVTSGSFALRGTAAHSSGISRVTWSSDRGGWGPAGGTSSWDTGPIVLTLGTNRITVTAVAKDGTTTSKTVQVEYRASAMRDSTAPSVSIQSPGATTLTTDAESVVVSGTARDNTGVTEVVWFTSTGLSGRATGTEAWLTPSIPLLRGHNSIVLRAFDAAGNMGWRSMGITRR